MDAKAKTVLIVEDNELNMKLFHDLLEAHGYDTLQTKDGIMKSRGRWVDYDTGTRKIRAIASFHPAYLLRSPGYKRMAWVDLRAIASALAALPPR